MDVLVVADGHYYQTPNGCVYADSVYDYNFYKRYLLAFDHVYAVVRVIPVDVAPKGKRISSGDRVSFLTLPYYKGPIDYIKKYFAIRKTVRRICKQFQYAVFRIPAATSNIFCREFVKLNRPFAVEVVVDPWENFGPRASGNKLINAIVRYNWTSVVREICMKANGVSYVTKKYLQERYPCKAMFNNPEYFTASYSSVELADTSYLTPRQWNSEQKIFFISHVANYFSGYGKGHITVMNAVKIVRDRGYDVRICFVGDGPKRKEFEQYAFNIGIADYVEFAGRLSNGDEVREKIRNSDIFILPTYAEGLPRVILEAMSLGLPCLSSPTCGIPEILDKEYLYDFQDDIGFANGIEKFVKNPLLMTNESCTNLNTAKKFSASKLNECRRIFYQKLRNVKM